MIDLILLLSGPMQQMALPPESGGVSESLFRWVAGGEAVAIVGLATYVKHLSGKLGDAREVLGRLAGKLESVIEKQKSLEARRRGKGTRS
jgi:hypothetical protein